jgi:hypothetical protein
MVRSRVRTVECVNLYWLVSGKEGILPHTASTVSDAGFSIRPNM